MHTYRLRKYIEGKEEGYRQQKQEQE